MLHRILPFLISIYLLIFPTKGITLQGNIDLTNAQSSVGTRFAKVFCEASQKTLANLVPTEDCALVKSILPCKVIPLVGKIKRYIEIKNGRIL